MVAEFLSEVWFESLGEALAQLADGLQEEHEGGLAIGQIVTGVPGALGAAGALGGEVRYTIIFDAGSASLVRNSTARAQVVLVADWDTAEAIASGRSSVPEMLNAGKLKLRGEARALVAAGDFLARIGPLLAEPRSAN